MIARGSTPTHALTLPISGAICDKIRATYAQDGEIVLQVNKDRMQIAEDMAKWQLTQEETLAFDSEKLLEIQIQILTTGGDSLVSKIIREPVGRNVSGEVLK